MSKVHSPPIRYKVSIPTEVNIVLEEDLRVNLTGLDGKEVLHVFDTATHFSAATFYDTYGARYCQYVDNVWLDFVMIWCTKYSGYRNHLPTDRGSIFMSDRWNKLTNMNGVQLRLPGTDAHSSLGIGEHYHEPLRWVHCKTQFNHPTISLQYILRLAVKDMNDTIGDNGLVPSRIVFGILSRLPILSTDIPREK